MRSLHAFTDFVHDQASFHAGMAKRFATSSSRRSEQHAATAKEFNELLEAIERSSSTEVPAAAPDKPFLLNLSFEDVAGLPEELLQELSISSGDKADFILMRIIERLGGIASLDRLLIGMYRETGEIHKRSSMTSRIYRMTQKGQLFAVPGRKGVYSVRDLSPEEADQILGSS